MWARRAAQQGTFFARRFSTAAAPQPEPAWFEPVRLGVRWFLIPSGFFASMNIFGTGLGGLAFTEAASAPEVLDRANGVLVQAGTKDDGSPAFTILYEYKGQKYESHNVVPAPANGSLATLVPQWLQKYRVGNSYTVFVHPDYPEKGFLEPGPRIDYVAATATGIILSLR
jgi:hypothetical protein